MFTLTNIMASSTARSDAEKALKSGRKALKTGLFQWNPDFTTAASQFVKAGKAFAQAKDIPMAVEAYIAAAEAYTNDGAATAAAAELGKAGKTLVCAAIRRAAGTTPPHWATLTYYLNHTDDPIQ